MVGDLNDGVFVVVWGGVRRELGGWLASTTFSISKKSGGKVFDGPALPKVQRAAPRPIANPSRTSARALTGFRENRGANRGLAMALWRALFHRFDDTGSRERSKKIDALDGQKRAERKSSASHVLRDRVPRTSVAS